MTLTLEFDHLLKTLTLHLTFEQRVLELLYEYSLWYDLSGGTISFDTVTLTFEFDPFFIENFNFANNFWTVSARALIFHMSIPYDKSFLLVL